MKITFLGTGAAWGNPELGCNCDACSYARTHGGKDRRRRTALFVETSSEKLLVDCGPDIREQLMGQRASPGLEYDPIEEFDALLITHSHTDHINGLDELSALRRSEWVDSIPAYATESAWGEIMKRFGYLVGNEGEGRLFIRRLAFPGVQLVGLQTNVTPFKVEHGPTAPGAVGYIFQDGDKKVVYTGDFYDVPIRDERLKEPDLLIMECNWYNEPRTQPKTSWHMSFQRALSFIQSWSPKRVVLVHISHEDFTRTPLNTPIGTIPKNHAEWQLSVNRKRNQVGLGGLPIEVSYDGMVVTI